MIHASGAALACALAAFAVLATPPRDARADEPESAVHGRPRTRYLLEGIELHGNTRTAPRVVLRSIKLRRGDEFDLDDAELVLARYRLLATGFFSSVQFSLRKGSRRGAVHLVVDVTERNTLVLEGLWLGVAADEDTAGNAEPLAPFVGAQLAERNLIGTGITLGAGAAVAEDQLALRARIAVPSFPAPEWTLSAGLSYANARDFFGNRDVLWESPGLGARALTDYAVVAYERSGGSLGAGRELAGALRLEADYRLEQIDAIVPRTASHLRGARREPIVFDMLPGRSVLSALAASLVFDDRENPLLPVRGTFARVSLAAGAAPLGSDYAYAKLELEAARWLTLPWRHVLKLSAYGGAVTGSAPFYEQFYVGDLSDLLPGRLLGLAPDRRQPPNLLGTSIIEVRYGTYAAKLEAEYRVPLYAGRESIYAADLFVSAGAIAIATDREFTEPAAGYTGLALIPADLTYNLGLRVDTSVGALRIAFSNLLGLLPPRRGERK